MKQILLKPVISEKSMSQTEKGKYVFVVGIDCNKLEITKAVKESYKVEPISVNIINVMGKDKNWRGRPGGRTNNWKKAVVTVKKGQKIPGFEVK